MATSTDAESMIDGAFDKAKKLLEGLGFNPMVEAERAGVRNGRFAAGWKIEVPFEQGQKYTLAVLLPEGFPHQPPRLAVLDAPPLLKWPHLEEDGLLCVFPPETSADPEAPAEQVRDLVHEGVRLLEDILAGRLEIDFEREFTAYWRRGADRRAGKFMSLLEPNGGHREVCIWRGKSFSLVAENAEELRRWLENQFGREKATGKKIAKSLCLRGKAAVHPRDYPRTAADLGRLFAGDAEALELIARQAIAGGDRDVVVAFATPTGTGFAAVSIAESISNRPPGKSSVDPMWKGFRKGRLPAHIAAVRATSASSKVTRHEVERVDHGWIHGRDHDPRQAILKLANVLVVGCGSLGSSVAELLARAGVGRITIMDGEKLDWPNISRHALGADQIGKPKASAVARKLTAAFPHLQGLTAIDQNLTAANADELTGRDLVITTTGTWGVDSLVNDWQRSSMNSTVLYAWLEPHAAAAHGVTIFTGGACLRCQMSSRGRPIMTVTEWPEGGALAVPSCGGTFTPYGAAELTFAHAMVVEQALETLTSPQSESRHAVWIGRTSRWRNLGGIVSPTWRENVGDPGEGGLLVVRPWLKKEGCPICGKQRP